MRVPTRLMLMAGVRRGGGQPGKSDPIDAQAVAMAALRHSDLPVAVLDGPAREVKSLSITAAIWSLSGPVYTTDCVGTYTNSTRHYRFPAAVCAATACSPS